MFKWLVFLKAFFICCSLLLLRSSLPQARSQDFLWGGGGRILSPPPLSLPLSLFPSLFFGIGGGRPPPPPPPPWLRACSPAIPKHLKRSSRDDSAVHSISPHVSRDVCLFPKAECLPKTSHYFLPSCMLHWRNRREGGGGGGVKTYPASGLWPYNIFIVIMS